MCRHLSNQNAVKFVFSLISGTNVPVTIMLAALIVLCVVALSYMLCQRETKVDKYNKLIEEIRD